MNVFICGNWATRTKPCKYCKQFLIWGISTGYCSKKGTNVNYNNHCKYYKRDSEIWTVSGKCKVDENELYV